MPIARRTYVFVLVTLTGIVAAGILGTVARTGGHGLDAGVARYSNPSSTAQPKAAVDQLEYKLGIVDSLDTYRHTFTIRNEGDAPLLIARGPATCKCTMTDLPETPIPPGGQAEIGVSYTNDGHTGPFTVHPVILTNDPDHPAIHLKIVGTSRARLAAEPRQMTFTIEPPKYERSVSTLVYSQVWDRFKLTSVKPSLEAVQWRIEPATNGQLASVDARSGYNVEVTMPPGMVDGRFSESIQIAGKPADPAEAVCEIQLDLRGAVSGRVTVHGPKIDNNRVLHLGAIPAGKCVRENLIVHVREEPRTLTVRDIKTNPAFVRTRVAPYENGLAKIGLYRIEVEIPAESPPCNCMGKLAGTIRMETDHPKIPVIELKIEFAVLDN